MKIDDSELLKYGIGQSIQSPFIRQMIGVQMLNEANNPIEKLMAMQLMNTPIMWNTSTINDSFINK